MQQFPRPHRVQSGQDLLLPGMVMHLFGGRQDIVPLATPKNEKRSWLRDSTEGEQHLSTSLSLGFLTLRKR